MRQTLAVLLGLLSLVLGGVLLSTYVWPEWGTMLVAWWSSGSGRFTISIVGGLAALLPLLQALRWWREWRRSREISYTTENGRITVSLIAIEEALTRALEGENEVKRATVHVYEDRAKRAVIIEAKVTLWEVPNLTERNRFCQRLLRRRFAELMPEQTAVQVLITIYRIYQRRASAKSGALVAVPVVPESPAIKKPLDSDVYLPDFDDAPENEDDLYHGPNYPVTQREEEDESGTGTGLYGRPPSGTRPGVKTK